MARYYGIAMSEYDKNSLRHFGILGQKWGIRRFQNEDRTLTPEGKERYYGKSDSKQYQKHENNEFNPRERWGQNGTWNEGEFSRGTVASIYDKKLMKQLEKTIDKSDDPRILTAKDLGDQYSDMINKLQSAFDKYDGKYNEEYGEFDGDGTEAHWKFEELYPEYKKTYDEFVKSKAKFIDAVSELAESSVFRDIKSFDKYKDYFDEIQDPNTGEYWYKHASAKICPIAMALTKSEDVFYDMFPPELITSYDSKGNVLFKPWE